METIYCQGCGAQIQTEEPEKPGYTPASSLERDMVLCQRCFRLKNYNEVQDVPITDNDFLQMVSKIRETDGLILHVIDIFDTEGSLINGLPRITGDNPIVLAGNKVDLLPKSVNKQKLIHWLRRQAKEAGMKVKDVFLISSTKGYGIRDLANRLEDYRMGKDVYIVGTTNVGKSTFVNQLIKQSEGPEDAITTSYFPGTTLGFIEIPLDETSSIIDTPGIVNKQQMAHYVSKQDLKQITPNKEIKPRVYQLNEEQTLFFGGLARLDFVKGERQSFVCYFSNQLTIHRTKLDKADTLYENHLGELLSPPDEETLETLPELTSNTFRVAEEKTDVVFPGLGWVSISGEGATVTAYSPKGAPALVRPSLL